VVVSLAVAVKISHVTERDVSTARGIFFQLCPRCRGGKIFRRSLFLFPGMHERCPVCDLKFEREEGYFLGAMYIGYGLGLGTITIFGLVLWWWTDWMFQKIVIAAVLLFLPFAPFLTLFARVLWIYLDQAIDPDRS
jgi:uncharacterized protein (DUF983 family)